ncbi:MAG: hypothetical protein AABX70_03505 [Nanoarchaeota archaeon]
MKTSQGIVLALVLLALLPFASAMYSYNGDSYNYYNNYNRYNSWDYPYRYQSSGYWQWHPYSYSSYSRPRLGYRSPYSSYYGYGYGRPSYYYHPWRWNDHDGDNEDYQFPCGTSSSGARWCA